MLQNNKSEMAKLKYIKSNFYCNGYISTWILHQNSMFSNKIKRNTQRAKITIPRFRTLYPIPFPHIGWKNWPINHRRNSNRSWRQFSSVKYILHIYYRIRILCFFFFSYDILLNCQIQALKSNNMIYKCNSVV